MKKQHGTSAHAVENGPRLGRWAVTLNPKVQVVAVSSTLGTSHKLMRTLVLHISATLVRSSIQGMYDPGKPGREAVSAFGGYT